MIALYSIEKEQELTEIKQYAQYHTASGELISQMQIF
jgi:hypothetical protein